MKVLALTKYGRRAASCRQRFEQYLPYLRKNGVEVEIVPLLDDSYLENYSTGARNGMLPVASAYVRRLRQLLSRNFDLLWVQYELFPFMPGFVERLASLTGRPVVVDFDDAIFHTYDHHRSALVRGMLGRRLEPLLRQAAACVCGNDYLAAYASRFCADVVRIPTVVDTDRYVPVEKPAGGSPSVVGWLGSPSTWQNVEPLLPEILPILQQHGAEFHVTGAGPAARGISGVRALEWTEDGEIGAVQAADIGIMPLLDRPFQRGKCGYKIIQYMACAVPVVASPVGVNADIVVDGVNGFLANTPEEWRAALGRLLSDPTTGSAMGARGRERAVSEYSLQSQQRVLLDTLNRAASSKAAQRSKGAA